ncbi:MMPL family transporter [Sulfurimonas sp. MAG313]|nr:efflux RND transporter permease subunit [Sulfurimonas sp. MAG313]MDF1881192.1 MMPL family transporter [Sulfurimonas sp. MAG313]
MKKVTNAADNLLYKMGHGISSHKFKVLLSILMILALMISNLPRITLDTSTEGFLHENDPVRIAYDTFQDQFGHDEKIVIAIKTDGIFKLKHLSKLKELHNELSANVPYLNDITSLINARNTTGDAESLLVEDLFQTWPKNEAELQRKKALALSNPMYKDLLVNSDGTFNVIVLEANTYTSIGLEKSTELDDFDEFDEEPLENVEKPAFISDSEMAEMVHNVKDIVSKYDSSDFKIELAGSPSVTETLKSSMQSDIKKFNGLIILTIIIILSLLFKRVSGVLFPLLAVVLSVLSTVGLMAYFGTPIKIPTQILPSFILAVGIGTSIHVMAIFFHHFDKYGDKNESIAYTLKHSGLAIIMTSITTAAGIGAFSLSSVAPVADLGMYGAAGVIIALVVSLVLLPTLISIFPLKRKAYLDKDHKDYLEKILEKIAHFSQVRAKPIVISSLLLMALFLFLVAQIRYSHNPLTWLPEGNTVRTATEHIDKEMRGTISLELIIDTKKENGLYDYELLKSIEKLGMYAETIETDAYFVGKVVSIVDVMKEIHKALHANDDKYYAIAQDPELIAQEILLFENSGSDDLEDFVDSQFSKARMTIKMPWVDAIEYHGMLEDLKIHLENNLPPGVEVQLTGMIPLLSDTIAAAISSSGESYIIAIFAIGFMMILLLGSFKLGLVSMIPNLFPVFFIIAFMVVFNIPFDLFTMLAGTIVLGLAVDDNVHFMHNFRRFKDEGKSTEEAVRLTLTGSGRAMLITTIVLSLGFFVYLFASMANLFNFGLIVGVAIIVALIADFFIGPALMALLYKDKE